MKFLHSTGARWWQPGRWLGAYCPLKSGDLAWAATAAVARFASAGTRPFYECWWIQPCGLLKWHFPGRIIPGTPSFADHRAQDPERRPARRPCGNGNSSSQEIHWIWIDIDLEQTSIHYLYFSNKDFSKKNPLQQFSSTKSSKYFVVYSQFFSPKGIEQSNSPKCQTRYREGVKGREV